LKNNTINRKKRIISVLSVLVFLGFFVILIEATDVMAYNYNCFYPNPDSGPNYVCAVYPADTNPDKNCALTTGVFKVDLGEGNCFYRSNAAPLASEENGRAIISCKGGGKIFAGDKSQRPDCEINADQKIYPGIYYMGHFHIDTSVTLTVIPLTSGMVGGGGDQGYPSYCGGTAYFESGGIGGIGGALLRPGIAGGNEFYTFLAPLQPSLYKKNLSAENGGGLLELYASTIVIEGTLSASGGAGSPGWFNAAGQRGAGGAGGGGGGKIMLFANEINVTGTAQLIANGGLGGGGGNGDCGGASKCEHQGNGGSGGGGNAGEIELNIRNPTSRTLTCAKIDTEGSMYTSTKGGSWSENRCGPVIDCYNPYTGNTQTAYCRSVAGTDNDNLPLCTSYDAIETTGDNPYALCNNGIDDDGNGLIDMKDPACFNITGDGGTCPSSNYGPMSGPINSLTSSFPSWFKQTTTNGYDACCGDDDYWLNGNFEIMTDLTNTECSGMPYGWSCDINPSECQSRGSDPIVAHRGECSLELFTINSDKGSSATKLVDLASGNYIVSVWVYSSGIASQNKASLFINDSTPGNSKEVFSTRNDSWQYLNTTISVNKNPVTILLKNLGTGDAYTLFDDLRVEKLNSTNNKFNPYNTLQDYGFIDNSDKYFCNDLLTGTSTYSNSPHINYTWLDAAYSQNAFKIITVGTPSGSSDVISNGQKWFYCNAMNNSALNAYPMNESGTFASAAGFGRIFCKDALTTITFSTLHTQFVDCNSTRKNYCCLIQSTGSYSVPIDQFQTCAQNGCYGKTVGKFLYEDKDEICSTPLAQYYSDLCNAAIGPGTGSETELLKEQCNFDLTGCLQGTLYDYTKSCTGQPGGLGKEILDRVHFVCRNGVYVKTNESNKWPDPPICCYGVQAEKVPKPTAISDQQNCTDEGGAVYDTRDSTCIDNGDLAITGEDHLRCCFGGVVPNSNNNLAWYSSVSPDAFKCFRQNGLDVIGECCYNNATCPSAFRLKSQVHISYGDSKIYSTGGVFHTITNFDKFDDNGTLTDMIRKINMTEASPATVSLFDAENNHLDLTKFSFLEFDVAYTQKLPVFKFNGRDLGPLSKYSINGDSTMRWHHIVVPLDKSVDLEFKELLFDRAPGDQSGDIIIVIDNIIATPMGADLNYNSQNQYCTGGFGTWITDLDPNYPYSNKTFWDDWRKYGPYKFACNAQGAFGWTGHQCCGDDTKTGLYGEHFNDTGNGCFNGSMVIDGWPVWKAKGITDNKPPNQNLMTYQYKDLIYFNNTFMSCQAKTNNYNWLNSSFDGNKPNAASYNLVTKDIPDQCRLLGTFYCMNNAWRELMPGYNDFDPKTSKIDRPITSDMIIQFKEAPPGGEIIYNGKFGGDAPTCTDGMMNGLETDRDCGGKCAPCAIGKHCNDNPDCLSDYCNGGICAP